MIATDRVSKTLFQTGSVKSKNPSMTNYPAYVPVIVDDCPAANKPTAQIYFALFPRLSPRISPAYNKLISSRFASGFFLIYTAKVEITNVLIMKEIKSAAALSIAL